ncbi:HEAT repeat domain-containing protein [Gordonia sp. 'Campus']|uniref:HEAT repeat domain-containing protein n=1 Tax=Gordonia sp. 'Campus' TaxID=2915824 RepID=UPI001EE3A5EC|nr:HEAT repeat domain-containing protein [Gordonia sp. 'Campus']
MITSLSEYESLLNSDDLEDRHRAARDSAPAEVWLRIISEVPEYRAFVVQNKTLPLDVLRILAQDVDRDVRFTVAMRRAAAKDETITDLLASDPDAGVRAALAKNPKLSQTLLQRLARDEDEWVRECAENSLAQRTKSSS